MRFTQLSTIALCAVGTQAFQNTSPLFIYSSIPSTFNTGEFASGSQVSSALAQSLEACQADAYILVQQANVSAQDFSTENSAPHLRRRMSSSNNSQASHVTVPEVFGQIDVAALRTTLQQKCGASIVNVDASRGIISSSESYPQIINVDFPAPPRYAGRAAKLQEHDSFLNAVISNLETKKFTVIYTTTPAGADVQAQQPEERTRGYEAPDKFQNVMHTNLKRDLESHLVARANTTVRNVALFEAYSFLSPGIFMGLVAALLLGSILYVGVSAIASLEIPIMAFSKEMGPSAQKKQQ